MIIKEIQCKSILTKSKLPEVAYCINPYVGCMHKCAYCYASFMRRFTNHNEEEWGKFLDVKINAVEILEKELISCKKKGTILLGSVTDAYQPAERKYQLSRKILRALSKSDFPVSILTKSSLVSRDIDILQKIDDCEVGLTITSLNDKISRIFEPLASKPNERIDALQKLKKGGIRTYAFIGPMLSGATKIDEILSALKGNVDFVMFESLNVTKSNIAGIKKAFVDANLDFEQANSVNWSETEKNARRLSSKHSIGIKGFYHH